MGTSPLEPQVRRAKKSRIDVVEIRLDSFPMNTPFLDVVKGIRKRFRGTILLTFRGYKEGGLKKLSDENRLVVLKPLLNYCDWVDCEILCGEFTKSLTIEARRQRKKVIHSFHDFSKVPSLSKLNQIKTKAKRLKSHFLKLAVKPRTEKELALFLKWGKDCHPRPILIGMGQKGQMSRFVGYSFRSIAAFGHLGKPAAPGQPAVQVVSQTIRDLYGHS